MQIAGVEVNSFSSYDGKPIKNHLHEDLVRDLKTKSQWLEEGYTLKANAVSHEMHPSAMAKRTCEYFHRNDVEPLSADKTEKNCLTCKKRKNRYCDFAGDYVSANTCCSEWTSK